MAETIFKADGKRYDDNLFIGNFPIRNLLRFLSFFFVEHPHIRYNPLKDEWVIVSPHRLQRPWSGQVEDSNEDEIPEFDPSNPLCPGVTRPNGKVMRYFSCRCFFDFFFVIY